MVKRTVVFAFFLLFVVRNTNEMTFERTVLAVGFPYYKMSLSLGTCHEKMLFDEQKVWANVRMNRIFDIYYASKNHEIQVSKVDITLVVNNTDCFALSDNGVGYRDFAATVIIPTSVAVMFYRLTIYTCSYFKEEPQEKFDYTARNRNNGTINDFVEASDEPTGVDDTHMSFRIKTKPL